MVDKSCSTLVRTIEDMLINVDKFPFPLYLMVVYIEARPKLIFILGRPFMNTARMLMDIGKGQVKVQIKDHEVYFKVKVIM